MNKEQKSGIVYVLTNEAMPGLVKIGKTKDIKGRLKNLYKTGVPVPFDCAYACEVEDMDKVESALHKAFEPSRLNRLNRKKREFFAIEPEQAMAILELHGKDVTPSVQKDADAVDSDAEGAKEKLRKSRPSLSLAELKVPNGANLVLNSGPSVEVKVADNESNKVETKDGEIMSLRKATKKYYPKVNAWKTFRPYLYWSYNDTLLDVLFDEVHNGE